MILIVMVLINNLIDDNIIKCLFFSFIYQYYHFCQIIIYYLCKMFIILSYIFYIRKMIYNNCLINLCS